MFSYDVMSEEEVQKAKNNLLEYGIYNFELASNGQHKVSHNGNSMISLMLRVYDKEGKEHIVFDNLVRVECFAYKTRHFCQTVGLYEQYNNKTFNENLCKPGLSGKVIIKIEKERFDSKSGKTYPAKNAVVDYMKAETSNQNKIVDEKFDNDSDLPF